ncbi:YfzA family protein [Cytobacillus sp. Hm23]
MILIDSVGNELCIVNQLMLEGIKKLKIIDRKKSRGKMSGAKKTYNTNLAKRWMITIGIFLIVQLIFITVDGTFLEPNIHDSDHLIAKFGRWVLESKLFTQWITPYSFPFFNLFMTI